MVIVLAVVVAVVVIVVAVVVMVVMVVILAVMVLVATAMFASAKVEVAVLEVVGFYDASSAYDRCYFVAYHPSNWKQLEASCRFLNRGSNIGFYWWRWR